MKLPIPRHERIYIMPTGFGAVFVVGAVTMILVGATYQNNLVNMLAFFMLSLVFTSMVQTHNNLKEVKLSALEIESGFAGGQFVVTTVLTNTSRQPRFNMEAGLYGKKPIAVYENVQPLLSQGTLKLRSTYKSPERGRHAMTSVKISTVYPLGLFRSWVWFKAPVEYYIYPEPKGNLGFPSASIGETSLGSQQVVGGDDFNGHRRFENSDSFRHIDWKAYARGRPMMVKLFNEGAPSSIQLDWNRLEGLDTEARLSQLSAWVEEAKTRRLPFGMRIPGHLVGSGQGQSHATHCLEALAIFESPTKKGSS